MGKNLTTNQKKCPKCGSEEVEHLGSTGAGATREDGLLPPYSTHHFRCKQCGELFSYRGRLG